MSKRPNCDQICQSYFSFAFVKKISNFDPISINPVKLHSEGRSILSNHFIDMRTTVSLSISCRKNVFLLKFSNKNTFFPYEMDKLTVVLMSIKRQPLSCLL